METKSKHESKPEAGRAKIPVNFIVIFFVCLLFLTGCEGQPSSQIVGATKSGSVYHQITCVDGVEYLYLKHGYGGYMAPHFKTDGSLYLCELSR